MKILIPSNDKKQIAEIFEQANYFIFYEAGKGIVKIIEERKNPIKENFNKSEDEQIEQLYNFLCDCEIIICKKIHPKLSTKFKSSNTLILKTLETNSKTSIINMVCR
jgi:predicted Fe-Mo cluster-binding NifX family protein